MPHHIEATGNYWRAVIVFDAESDARLFAQAMPDDRDTGRAFTDWLAYNLVMMGDQPYVQRRLRALLPGFKSYRVYNQPPDEKRPQYQMPFRPLNQVLSLPFAQTVADFGEAS